MWMMMTLSSLNRSLSHEDDDDDEDNDKAQKTQLHDVVLVVRTIIEEGNNDSDSYDGIEEEDWRRICSTWNLPMTTRKTTKGSTYMRYPIPALKSIPVPEFCTVPTPNKNKSVSDLINQLDSTTLGESLVSPLGVRC
jgi:hypothetical protein